MIVTTAERTIAKLETQVSQPLWLCAVLDDVDSGFLVESAEEIAYVNRAYARILGYEPDELLGSHLSRIVADDDAARLLEYGRHRARFETAPRSYPFRARHRDSSAVPLVASVSTACVDRRVVIATFVQECDRPQPDRAGVSDHGDRLRSKLSPREVEVMEMILSGKRSKEIAFALNLSPKTVSTHRQRLLNKLQLTDTRALFQYALRHRLIDWS